MNARSAAALAVGCGALVWIVVSVGTRVVGHDIAVGGWALPATSAVFLVQLALSAQAWQDALGGQIVGRARLFRLRWIREGINALLPVAQVGGQVVVAGLLARQGMAPTLAAAGTLLDLTLEAISQLLFTLAGVAALLAMRPGQPWVAWLGGGVMLTALGVAIFVVLQRVGVLRLVEMLLGRLARHHPGTAGWSMQGLHTQLMARQADHPAMARAMLLHTVSWALGGAEVWILLAVLGHRIGALDSVVVESLGMAARSAGFAIPGAVGVQEGGFVLVCGVFGVPAEAALALSVLKRLREAVVGVPALVAWQAGAT